MDLIFGVFDMKVLPVVLCGGSGSRLWPLSREKDPKPFVRLKDDTSLIQQAFQKAGLVGNVGKILTVTNKDLEFRVKSDFDELELPISNEFILESEAKNTAPAIALAAMYTKSMFGDDVNLLVLAADHIITDDELFINAVNKATILADDGKLVTFGIQPNKPETGYGYIHYENNTVKNFVEKPDVATAKAYVQSGEYLWNSGMFCFRPDVFLSELQKYRPQTLELCQEIYDEMSTVNYRTKMIVSEDKFAQLTDESVDYAVMENSDKIAVVPCQFSWSDVGSWDSLAETLKDQTDNVLIGQEHTVYDSENCFFYSKDKLIAGIGLKDLVIVDTDDALLVAHRSQSQDVKKVYNELKAKNHESHKLHTTAHRPWGTYTILDESLGYKVKRIEVYPGQRLSLQHHHYRSEHWIIVQGKAEVVNGDETVQLGVNQSIYIPQGNIHRLVNIGTELLVMIEVQCGNYLGEDDIVRHQDDYARV